MKRCVYLAGPITGLSYQGCTDWRDKVASQLNSDNVEALSPMRGKLFLLKESAISNCVKDEYPNAIASSKGITRRDMFDTCRSSCVILNMLGATRVSIGTVMEIAWAYREHIPTIVVMEKDNLHSHAMFNEAATYIVESLDEAVRLAKFLLNEGAES